MAFFALNHFFFFFSPSFSFLYFQRDNPDGDDGACMALMTLFWIKLGSILPNRPKWSGSAHTQPSQWHVGTVQHPVSIHLINLPLHLCGSTNWELLRLSPSLSLSLSWLILPLWCRETLASNPPSPFISLSVSTGHCLLSPLWCCKALTSKLPSPSLFFSLLPLALPSCFSMLQNGRIGPALFQIGL